MGVTNASMDSSYPLAPARVALHVLVLAVKCIVKILQPGRLIVSALLQTQALNADLHRIARVLASVCIQQSFGCLLPT